MFQNTFGCDPQVTIGDLDTSKAPYRLPIIVDDEQKGTSLRTIIRKLFPIGNISVVTDVTNKKGESWQTIVIKDSTNLKDVFTSALTGNPLFVESVVIPHVSGGFNFYSVAVIFTRSVVQFFNDDLSEYRLISEQEDSVEVQKKTFTNWANEKLKTQEGVRLADLETDLEDGVILIKLLEMLAPGKRMPGR